MKLSRSHTPNGIGACPLSRSTRRWKIGLGRRAKKRRKLCTCGTRGLIRRLQRKSASAALSPQTSSPPSSKRVNFANVSFRLRSCRAVGGRGPLVESTEHTGRSFLSLAAIRPSLGHGCRTPGGRRVGGCRLRRSCRLLRRLASCPESAHLELRWRH